MLQTRYYTNVKTAGEGGLQKLCQARPSTSQRSAELCQDRARRTCGAGADSWSTPEGHHASWLRLAWPFSNGVSSLSLSLDPGLRLRQKVYVKHHPYDCTEGFQPAVACTSAACLTARQVMVAGRRSGLTSTSVTAATSSRSPARRRYLESEMGLTCETH